MGQFNFRRNNKRFNLPPGRQSNKRKRKYLLFKKILEKNPVNLTVDSEHISSRVKPYKIVNQIIYNTNGQRCVKVCVKRLHATNQLKCVHVNPNSLKLSCVNSSSPFNFETNRVINLKLLQSNLNKIIVHSSACCSVKNVSSDPITFIEETNRNGLGSIIVAKCICGKTFSLETSKTVDNHNNYEINLRTVWGSMVTGTGPSQVNEALATMDIPGITYKMYSKIENDIGEMWLACLQQDMLDAGQEEKRLAEERGDFHQEVPAITVICDGGWSKRSHKHTYDALGGVAVIFGAETGKLLHIGVRNRHCQVCTMASTKGTEPKDHTCFKNWDSSSQAMESDILCQGFKSAENTHGVRYMRLIADGDSSVFHNIQQSVPIWGKDVTKLECANHACKCLRSSLEKLVNEKPHYKGKGKLTRLIRIRLTTAVRCAIKMRSNEAKLNRQKATKQLEHDIRNSVHHIFGNHANCSDFCKKKKMPMSETTGLESEKDNSIDTETLFCDIEKQWVDGTSEKDMEESRYDVSYETNLEQDMLRDITFYLNRLASKATKLIGNHTTNLAESWMSIRCKFDGGKTINRCQRGSWHARCYGGGLRKNFGPAWSPLVFHKVTGVRPGSIYTSHYRSRSFHLLRSLKSAKKPDVKGRSRKRKNKSTAVSTSKRARKEYGVEVPDVVADISDTDLKVQCESYFEKLVNVSEAQIQNIEVATKAQSLSITWKEERKRRLTASNFGEVFKKNASRSVTALATRLLYNSFKGNIHTSRGLAQESTTIKEYLQHTDSNSGNIKVAPMGLVIDNKNKFLAASTDGRVETKDGKPLGLIEVKNLLQRNQKSFQEAVKSQPSFCLEIVSNKLRLKRNHAYYFQCQGQANILQMPWVDFVVRRTNPNQLFIERIERDKHLWNTYMVPKLTAFYNKVLLPELSVPRHGLIPGIREPEKPWFVEEKTGVAQKKPRKNASNPPKAQKDPKFVEEKTSVAQKKPRKSASNPPKAQKDPKFVEEKTSVTQQKPRKSASNPPKAQKDPKVPNQLYCTHIPVLTTPIQNDKIQIPSSSNGTPISSPSVISTQSPVPDTHINQQKNAEVSQTMDLQHLQIFNRSNSSDNQRRFVMPIPLVANIKFTKRSSPQKDSTTLSADTNKTLKTKDQVHKVKVNNQQVNRLHQQVQLLTEMNDECAGEVTTQRTVIPTQHLITIMQDIPIAQTPLLSAQGQSPIQSVFIRPANQLQPQQGMMTTGVHTIGATIKARMDIPMNQVKTTNVNVTGVTVGKAPIPALNRTAKISPTPHSTVGRPKLAVPNISNPTRGRPRTIYKVTSVTPPTVTSTVTTVTTKTKPDNQLKQTPPVSMAVTPTPQVKDVSNGVTDAATKSTHAEPVLSMNYITKSGDATHVEKMDEKEKVKKKMKKAATEKETTVTSPKIHKVDPKERSYCVCQKVAYGEMIGCDNDACHNEWFHYNCVGLKYEPKGKWFCPNCRFGSNSSKPMQKCAK